MAHIFTDSQIHGYSLIFIKKHIALSIISLLLLAISPSFGQDYSKKAEKLVEKADEYIKNRQFEEATALLKKAISVDETYPQPYFKLTSIYNIYQQKDSAAAYYNRGLAVMPDDKISQKMWLAACRINFNIGNYQTAYNALIHLDNPDSLLKKSVKFAFYSLKNKQDLNQEVLPSEINAFSLQYFPVLTVDESKIIFTKRDNSGPGADEDIYISTKINGDWIPSQPISNAINTPYNEGACSISADGRMLIFTACEGRKSFGSCDLYVSYRNGNSWSSPENMGDSINSRYWDSQPALSADGRTLYFSSNRPGGVGKRDLWVSTKRDSGWTAPKNLGHQINTKGDETTPFIHVNGKTLFFSSDGHYGLGGLDLFVSHKNDSWTSPVNLGMPINTMNDEISLFINASGNYGYYAMENSAGKNSSSTEIVRFKIPYDTLLGKKASYVTGRVLDASTQKPLAASFKMSNLDKDDDVYSISSDPFTGKYFLVLTEGNQYGVFIQKQGYLFEDLAFIAQENSALEPDTVDILLKPIVSGESSVLQNLYFEFDSYKLSDRSRAELNDLVSFIKSHSKITYLVEGHTDNVGQESYNQDLSERRAHQVYDYLISRGIDANILQYKGFGSSRPIFPNDSEENRQKNRRINLTILSSH